MGGTKFELGSGKGVARCRKRSRLVTLERCSPINVSKQGTKRARTLCGEVSGPQIGFLEEIDIRDSFGHGLSRGTRSSYGCPAAILSSNGREVAGNSVAPLATEHMLASLLESNDFLSHSGPMPSLISR